MRVDRDVTTLRTLNDVDLVAAGFPCQDLSQAGGKRGIAGAQSGLVKHLFRLLRASARRGNAPRWVLIENVSYMLSLDRGRAMAQLTEALEELGYFWAYRVVDVRGLGLPQRRQRVVLLASLRDDPRDILFADEAEGPEELDVIGPVAEEKVYGFYWTEGRRGLGWAEEAVPTIKGGSRLGIPSPPAVWVPRNDFVGTPTLEDAERLQGFAAGWTEPANELGGRAEGRRWTLVEMRCAFRWPSGSGSDSPSRGDTSGQNRASVRWAVADRGLGPSREPSCCTRRYAPVHDGAHASLDLSVHAAEATVGTRNSRLRQPCAL